MPRKLSRGRRLVTTAGIAAIAALALPGAAAAADCPPQPTTTAFAAYGDANQYFSAPNGNFESLAGWTLRGAPSLIDGLNALGLGVGSSSADLDSGDGVATASFCVDSTMPHLRFAAKATGSGQLDVLVRVNRNGSTDSSSGSVSPSDHGSWKPSHLIELKTKDIPAGESATATVSFRSQGDWLIDDVFIDPYRR